VVNVFNDARDILYGQRDDCFLAGLQKLALN